MPFESIKPLLRSAIIGFSLGLLVVFTVGYTLSRGSASTPTLHR